jgi:hypothetical protein
VAPRWRDASGKGFFLLGDLPFVDLLPVFSSVKAAALRG